MENREDNPLKTAAQVVAWFGTAFIVVSAFEPLFGNFKGFIQFLWKYLGLIFIGMIIYYAFHDPYQIWASHKLGFVGIGICLCWLHLGYVKARTEEEAQEYDCNATSGPRSEDTRNGSRYVVTLPDTIPNQLMATFIKLEKMLEITPETEASAVSRFEKVFEELESRGFTSQLTELLHISGKDFSVKRVPMQ